MPFTRKTASPKSSPYIFLPLFLSSITRRVARCLNWHQSSTQKNAYPRRWKRISLVQIWWPTLRISFSTLWSKNQCLALGSSFWSSAKTSTFFFVLQTCCLGLCGWFLSPFPEVNFGNSIHFGHRFTAHYRDTSILEEIGIRQNDRLEWMDNTTRDYDRPTTFFKTRENQFSYQNSVAISLQEKSREDHRHPPLGYITRTPWSFPTHLIVSRPILHSSNKLQHCTDRMGIISQPPQWLCHHHHTQSSSPPNRFTGCRIQTQPNFFKLPTSQGCSHRTPCLDPPPRSKLWQKTLTPQRKLSFGQKNLFYHFSNPSL